MRPRSWFCASLLLISLLAACQPIRPITEAPPTPDPASGSVPSTSTAGETDCPIITDQPLDLLIEPKWQTGDVRYYRASSSRTPVRNGNAGLMLTSTFTMPISILAEDENGFVMEWQYRAMLPNPQKTRLEYSTTSFGEFVELRNLDELQDPLNLYIVQELISLGEPLPTGEIVAPPEVLAHAKEAIAKDILDFHAIYGLYFTNFETYVIEKPAMLTGTRIQGTNTIQITPLRYDATKGCLHLLWQSDWQADAGQSMSTQTASTRILFELNLNTGWLQNVEIERIGIIDGKGQIDHRQLTYVPPAN